MNDNIYQQTPPLTPQNSTLAMVSMIAGIVSYVIAPLIGAIVAIITGHMAKREIRESNGQLGGDGMATAGLVLGYLQLVPSVLCVCVVLILLATGVSIPILESLNF